MKDIDAGIEALYSSEPTRVVVCQICEIAGEAATYRFTDSPLPISWDGHAWANEWFDMSEFVTDAEGELSCTLTFEDASKTIRALAFSESLQDRVIKVWELWADPDDVTILAGTDLILQGLTDGVRCEEDSENPMVAIAVRGIFAASGVAIGPAQDYTRTCRYQQFKGEQCQYVGPETSCNRTYERCSTLTTPNQKHFGGFRYALDIGETVKWGTNQPEVQRERPVPPPVQPEPPAGSTTPVIPNRPGRSRSVRH